MNAKSKRFLGSFLILTLLIGLMGTASASRVEATGTITVSGNGTQSTSTAPATPAEPEAPGTDLPPLRPDHAAALEQWGFSPVRPPLHPQHVIIRERTFFTQEELRAMIEFAPDAAYTVHSSPHPMRAMTPDEVAAWSEEYFAMGGLNRQELELVYYINAERIAHGISPAWICPYLSQAARLMHQLTREQGTPGTNRIGDLYPHHDPFYAGYDEHHHGFFFPTGNAQRRFRLFMPEGGVLPDTFVSENLVATIFPRHAVSAWMGSPGHRREILSDFRVADGTARFIGVGASVLSSEWDWIGTNVMKSAADYIPTQP